jgi:phenylacetate-coenzyme A ligase PaaK-like adenylate-forming protein
MFETIRFVHTIRRLLALSKKPSSYLYELQQQKFRELLAYSVQHSPFYRRRFQHLDIQRCALADLPSLSKREMMTHFDDVVTDRRIRLGDLQGFLEVESNLGQYYLNEYVVCHTSGSQGQPAVIVQDKLAMEEMFACQLVRGNAEKKDPISILKKLIWPSRLAVVTLRRGFYPSGAAFEYMPPGMKLFTRTLRLSQNDGMDSVIARLNEYQPNFLTAYASVLEMLARAEKTSQLQLRRFGQLRQITNMSEPLSEGGRKQVEDVFGVRVVDNYAMAECMALSNGCTRFPGSHINIDQAIFEVVDRENRPVPLGTPGSKVLLTNLYNRVQPLIRYEIGDVLTLSANPCRCGSPFPHLASIQGRTKDKFWIHGERGYQEVLPYVFMAPLLHCLDLAEYQVAQVERNSFRIRVAALPGEGLDVPRVERFLWQGLQHEGLGELVRFRIEVVEAIHPDPRSGKVKRMLSLVQPPREKSELEAEIEVA